MPTPACPETQCDRFPASKECNNDIPSYVTCNGNSITRMCVFGPRVEIVPTFFFRPQRSGIPGRESTRKAFWFNFYGHWSFVGSHRRVSFAWAFTISSSLTHFLHAQKNCWASCQGNASVDHWKFDKAQETVRFAGSLLICSPSDVGFFFPLFSSDIRSNQISGTLPTEIGAMDQLTDL